jgi:hypothetical protein
MQRWAWLASIDAQAARHAAWCQERGIALAHHDAATHARALLDYLADGEAKPFVMTYADVSSAYLFMLDERRWHPVAWCQVGKHFTRLTGGKKYRNALDPRTGMATAKERIYRIPVSRALGAGSRAAGSAARVRSTAESVQQPVRLAA